MDAIGRSPMMLKMLPICNHFELRQGTTIGLASLVWGVLGGGLISHHFQTAHENGIIRFRNCLYKG
jgi:hypothetical protein